MMQISAYDIVRDSEQALSIQLLTHALAESPTYREHVPPCQLDLFPLPTLSLSVQTRGQRSKTPDGDTVQEPECIYIYT